MSKASMLLLGAGGHARVCIDVIEQAGVFGIAGIIGLEHEIGSRVLGYSVLGADEALPGLLVSSEYALVTVGQIKSPDLRIRLFELAVAAERAAPAVISPWAYVSPHATVGVGSIVMHGAVINAGATVGRNCIVNSQALVEHDVVVGDHCHISTGAAVNSGVNVGIGTFIGSNSSVRQLVTIGERCVIGMGAVVLADCAAGSRIISGRAS